MEILPMLARLENALGCPDLTRRMVLVSKSQPVSRPTLGATNLVVGYNGSPQSQTALDLTLWIAHQTRLATRRLVTVQVVYAIDLSSVGQSFQYESQQPVLNLAATTPSAYSDGGMESHQGREALVCEPAVCRTATAIAEPPSMLPSLYAAANSQIQQFEQADHILWQARHLANEWRGSLKTHLRFGSIAEELCKVAIAESATVMLVGCDTANHPLVERLAAITPCSILGIPSAS